MKARTKSAREDTLSRIKIALSDSDRSTRGSIKSGARQTGNGIHLVQEIRARCVENRAVLVEQFNRELAAVGGVFHRASSAEAACDHIVRVASSHKTRLAIGWNVAIIEEIGLGTRLEQAGVKFFTRGEGVNDQHFASRAAAADIGVTAVDYALADTATLVLRTGSGRARSVSLLPPVHIALLKPDQIIPGLDDLFPLLGDNHAKSNVSLDSALTFITGPSRTADIELTLVVGVHGPQELHVVLLDEGDCSMQRS
ncbi:MAG: lactate utilization protein [Blastocatellia bacterium]